MVMVEVSTDYMQYVLGKFYVLIVQSILYLFDSTNERILQDKPLLSLDIEFAKFMKIKPENIYSLKSFL